MGMLSQTRGRASSLENREREGGSRVHSKILHHTQTWIHVARPVESGEGAVRAEQNRKEINFFSRLSRCPTALLGLFTTRLV